jgi:hypothetical protein
VPKRLKSYFLAQLFPEASVTFTVKIAAPVGTVPLNCAWDNPGEAGGERVMLPPPSLQVTFVVPFVEQFGVLAVNVQFTLVVVGLGQSAIWFDMPEIEVPPGLSYIASACVCPGAGHFMSIF